MRERQVLAGGVEFGAGAFGLRQSLPDLVAQPAALVRVFNTSPSQPTFPLTPWNFVAYRREARAVDLAVYVREDLQLAAGGRAERLRSLRVSAEYCRVLGVLPVRGRAFTQAEERKDARVVILSDRLWRDRFAADPNVVGRTVRLSAETFTIVGVMPPGFQHVGGAYRSLPHGETVDAWWPIDLSDAKNETFSHYLNAVGRVRAGYTADQARGELERLEAALNPTTPAGDLWRIGLVPLSDEIVGHAIRGLALLMAAVGVVMLVACVNVAGLMLARGTARRLGLDHGLLHGARRG